MSDVRPAPLFTVDEERNEHGAREYVRTVDCAHCGEWTLTPIVARDRPIGWACGICRGWTLLALDEHGYVYVLRGPDGSRSNRRSA